MRTLLPLFFLGCEAEAEVPCETLCDELVKTCEYKAFPEYDSCVSGCLYDEEAGGQSEALRDCVLDAACDTFAVVECENDFGPTDD